MQLRRHGPRGCRADRGAAGLLHRRAGRAAPEASPGQPRWKQGQAGGYAPGSVPLPARTSAALQRGSGLPAEVSPRRNRKPRRARLAVVRRWGCAAGRRVSRPGGRQSLCTSLKVTLQGRLQPPVCAAPRPIAAAAPRGRHEGGQFLPPRGRPRRGEPLPARPSLPVGAAGANAAGRGAGKGALFALSMPQPRYTRATRSVAGPVRVSGSSSRRRRGERNAPLPGDCARLRGC